MKPDKNLSWKFLAKLLLYMVVAYAAIFMQSYAFGISLAEAGIHFFVLVAGLDFARSGQNIKPG